MRLPSLCVLALVFAGCFTPVPEQDAGVDGGGTGGGSVGGGSGGGSVGGGSGGGGAGGGGGATSQCHGDAECRLGEVCYVCNPSLPGSCQTGCNAGHGCPAGQSCFSLGITCFACPCLDTECRGQTCVDDDQDGFVAGAGCSTFPGGDCAPNDATVNPGAGERCGNSKDDDCDGLVDAHDPDCGPPMCMSGSACLTSWNCGLGTSLCSQGCCQSCPALAPPSCPPNQCPLSPTIDPNTGCMGPPECVTCPTTACPQVYAPVCATTTDRFLDPRTFGNPCEATARGATVVHQGVCLAGEGLRCGPFGNPPGCGPGTELYCRDACPECDADLERCTRKGVCITDLDCPAGLPRPPPLTCGNGTTAQLRCVDHACVQRCP